MKTECVQTKCNEMQHQGKDRMIIIKSLINARVEEALEGRVVKDLKDQKLKANT